MDRYDILKKAAIAVLLFSILTLGITLRVVNLNNVAARSPDENTYTYISRVIIERGITGGIRLLTQEQLSTPSLWIYFPAPPTRTGYFWLLANVMKLTHSADIKVGAYISFAFSVISMLLLIALGLRFFNPWAVLYALLFISVSPMDLAIARRTWQDSMVGCLGLSIIYLSCEISRNIRQVIWYIFLILVGSYYVSAKESAIFIYGLWIIWLLWVLLIKEKSVSRGLLLAVFSSLGIGIAAACIIYISGGIPNIIESLRCWIKAVPSNQYAIEYQSGPWYNYLGGFWIVSPVSAVLCLAGIAGSLFGRGKSPKSASLHDSSRRAILGIILFMIVFMAMAVATPHFQNFRYISILYVPFYLISGLGLWYIISLIRSKLKGFYLHAAISLIIVVLIAGAVRDYRAFEKIFIRTGIKDVSIKMLRDCSR